MAEMDVFSFISPGRIRFWLEPGRSGSNWPFFLPESEMHPGYPSDAVLVVSKVDIFLQVLASIGLGHAADHFGGALSHDLPAGIASLGSKVDDPVGNLDNIQVVFNNHHSVTSIHQPLQDIDQLVDIGGMQTDRRLVQDIDGLPGGTLGKFAGELYTLRFASGEGGCGLADPDIAQADILQGLKAVGHGWEGSKYLQGSVDGHIQHIRDAVLFETHLQGLAVEAGTMADLAGYINIRQELHLNPQLTLALACFATAAMHVEGESAGFVTSDLAFGQVGE